MGDLAYWPAAKPLSKKIHLPKIEILLRTLIT